MLKCFWLGLPLVQVGKRFIKIETRKATALLAYLSLTPTGGAREFLAAMFWPDYDQPHAMANLRRALASLNAAIPDGFLLADREMIRWRSEVDLWVDVREFQNLVKKVHTHCTDRLCNNCVENLKQGIDLYRGEFLQGLNLKDSPGFDEWQIIQREERQRELAEILGMLVEQRDGREQAGMSIIYARRWVALDPLNEPAQRRLMQLLLEGGQRSEAHRCYEEFSRLLEEQVGQLPEEETQALFRQKGTSLTPASPNSTSSFPLLKTKLFIPSLPSRWVRRGHLVTQMERIEENALTIISAPAGFGKTTLLAEWIAHTQLPVAWLSLDSGDNDPYRFLAYLVSALESIHEDIGREAQQFIQAAQPIETQIILASLLNDLAAVREPFALILDDYQFIRSRAVHEVISYLLDHLPRNMHVIISTRADPPLQLARLRANERILEIRTSELRFTNDEAGFFLNQVMGLGLGKEDINALEARTEGWVVGLKMAALSLAGRIDTSEFIHAFSGSNRYILDYLAEEVLGNQPTKVKRFLLFTSILDRLTAPLCDELLSYDEMENNELGDPPNHSESLPINRSASILEYLERGNLFLVSLDDERIWYRYHHLFADLLQVQLHRSIGAQGVTQLHICASDWYARNDLIQEAIHHASAAKDSERVERFIEYHYMELVHRGEQSWLRLWAGKLSKDLVLRRPWLCIYEAYSHAWFGELDEADRLLESADKHMDSYPPNSNSQSMRGLHNYVKSRVTAMQGDLPRAIEYCLAAREFTPSNNLALQLDTGITLGYEYFLQGEYAAAKPILLETVQAGVRSGAVLNTVAGACILARIDIVQGHLKKAYDTFQFALQCIPEARGQHLGARALVKVGLAEVFYEWNDLETALWHIKTGLEHLPLWGKNDDFVLSYLTLSRIILAKGNYKEAVEAAEKAVEIVQTRGVFSEAKNATKIAKMKLLLGLGDIQAAESWSADHKNLSSDNSYCFDNELFHNGWARVHIARNEPNEALKILFQTEIVVRSAGRLGRLLEILILKALALRDSGKNEQALIVLTESLELAEPEGFMRIFLDEGQPIIELLRMLSLTQLRPGIKRIVDRLLAAGTPIS